MKQSTSSSLFAELFFILAKVPLCLALELRADWAARTGAIGWPTRMLRPASRDPRPALSER